VITVFTHSTVSQSGEDDGGGRQKMKRCIHIMLLREACKKKTSIKSENGIKGGGGV